MTAQDFAELKESLGLVSVVRYKINPNTTDSARITLPKDRGFGPGKTLEFFGVPYLPPDVMVVRVVPDDETN